MQYTKTTKLSWLAFGLAIAAASTAAAQTYTPPAVSTVSTTTVATGLTQTQAVAVDPAGDIFYSQPGVGELVEQPAGSTTPITLYTEAAGGGAYPKGVAASSTYAYISSYSGNLWQVPVGGGTAKDILAGCSSIDNGYFGTITIAVDGAGNVYTSGDNETNIFKITPSGACSTVAGATLAADNNQFVGADAAGDLAYATDNVLYSLPAGASTPTVVAATFASITGLRSDTYGNVFLTDGSAIIEVPFINGTLDGRRPSPSPPWAPQTPSASAPTAASTPPTAPTSIATPPAAFASPPPPLAPHPPHKPSAASLTPPRPSPASPRLRQRAVHRNHQHRRRQLRSNTPYTAGSTCTITLSFTPSNLGLRRGAVVLSSAAGVVGCATVTGQGSGSGLVADPGTQTTLGTTWSAPDGVAVTSSGAVFVADKSAGTVSYIPAGSSTPTVIASSLSSPSGIAVDGAGNVYVANTAANNIVSIPFANGAYGTATAAISGLTLPTALAIGPGGSLYIANTGAGTVLRVPNQGGTLNLLDKSTVGTGFTAPDGLAVDASGNVDVADSSSGDITQIGATTSSTIVTGLTSPGAIATDDSGALYVIQSGVDTILRIPFASGAYNTNGTAKLGTGFTTPTSLAVDNTGNLYVADSGAATVTAIRRTAGSLNLGKVNEGDSSAEESLTLTDAGDQQLTFGSPLDTATGDTGDFTLDTSSSGDCAAGGTLSLRIWLQPRRHLPPTATGTRGNAHALLERRQRLVHHRHARWHRHQPARDHHHPQPRLPTGRSPRRTHHCLATVAPAAGATGTPTGTLQFYLNGVAYGNPVSLSGDIGSITISGLPATNNSISATYSGDSNFAGSTSKPLTVAVALAPTTTTLTATSQRTPVAPGTSVTLTATIASTVIGVSPTGTVTFTGNGAPSARACRYHRRSTLTSTALPTGTYGVTATYSGDSGFATSTSNAVPVAILPPGYPDTGGRMAIGNGVGI